MSYWNLISSKSGLCMNYGLTAATIWCPRGTEVQFCFKRGIFFFFNLINVSYGK